ncbi:class I SAM-dependent methyltransferase [Paenibacillus sp. FSL H7-0350]|uniref:SAM-dependent methyltransferase n=1 Tax=Paenibacillus sp. FSL H7-0350 TaxID=2975345 RepID=UPI00315991CF
MKNKQAAFEYSGDYYEAIGDFMREQYLKYGFAQGTMQEADFLMELMNLRRGTRTLDIGCGPGRHSLELARRGIRTVGVDISAEFIRHANREAARDKLPATFLVADARELMFDREFDGAICLYEGAFGLAGSEENHRKVLRGVQRALKPGSLFVLTAINVLNLARNIQDESLFDPYSCTVIDKEEIHSPEGESKEVLIYTTAFTFRELQMLLVSEGFVVEAAYGCSPGQFGNQPLQLGSIEIMMVARRK